MSLPEGDETGGDRSMTDKDNHYVITWELDVWADTPEQAALYAREVQLQPDSTATVFKVINMRLDPTNRGGVMIDRIIVHTVAHEGGVAVEIMAAKDDHPRTGGWMFEVTPDGDIGATFRNRSGGVPMSMIITARGQLIVRESEDLFANEEAALLFDSEVVP